MPKQRSRSLENIYINDAHRAIYSEISSVKRRIKLVEGERKANYELNEAELKKNEVLIAELRQKIGNSKKAYKELRRCKEDYSQVVAEAFGNVKKGYSFRGKTFEETEAILESLIGDLKNRINLLKYKNEETKQKLESLLKQKKQLERVLYRGNKNVYPMLKELREAENNGALMQMRIIEAENVQAKYKVMYETLKQENYTKNNQLNDMEKTIQFQKKEAHTIQSALAGALKARKVARMKLAEIEEQTMKEYGERDEKLLEERLRLRGIREQMEEIGTKLSYPKFHMAHRDSSLVDGLYFLRSTSATEEKGQNIIEAVYQRLVEMTGESNPIAIVRCFEQQRTHSTELDNPETEIKSQIRKEKLRKRFLEDKLIQLQFSGGIKREMLNKEIQQINDNIDETEALKSEAEKRIQELNEVMTESMKKLSDICIQNEIPLPESVDTKLTTADRVRGTLEILFDKVEEGLRQQESVFIFPSPMMSPENEHPVPLISYGSCSDLNALDSDLFGLGTGSISSTRAEIDRRKLSPFSPSYSKLREDSTIIHLKSEKKSESSEDEEVATRNSIKRQSIVMIDAKTRKGRFKSTSSAVLPRQIVRTLP